ncbi:MAG: hypothetical protein CMJ58_25335 [Planctomycetaceae bacterium]|nr:hypothetical protein [Planctomycetaceae bacterium]
MSRQILGVVVGLAAVAGCSSTIRWPQLIGPGPAPLQRAEAEISDPYPLPDLGPEVVGGRPREYAVPVPPVTRANQYNESRAAAIGTPLPMGPPLAPQTFGSYPNQPVMAAPRY